jgi:hypothetical protein
VIAGSRTVSPTIADIDAAVREMLLDLLAIGSTDKTVNFRDHIEEVISGDADGGDFAGERWAVHHGIPVWHEPITREDIEKHGKYVGPKMRNRRMAERGTHAIIFWDGTSGGSADMGMRMLMRRKPAWGVPFKQAERPRRRARR